MRTKLEAWYFHLPFSSISFDFLFSSHCLASLRSLFFLLLFLMFFLSLLSLLPLSNMFWIGWTNGMDPRVPWRRTFRVRETRAGSLLARPSRAIAFSVDCALEFGSDYSNYTP